MVMLCSAHKGSGCALGELAIAAPERHTAEAAGSAACTAERGALRPPVALHTHRAAPPFGAACRGPPPAQGHGSSAAAGGAAEGSWRAVQCTGAAPPSACLRPPSMGAGPREAGPGSPRRPDPHLGALQQRRDLLHVAVHHISVRHHSFAASHDHQQPRPSPSSAACA